MFQRVLDSRNRLLTLFFVSTGVLCALSAAVVGISDHPFGIALAYAGVTALLLAWIHPWRTAKRFSLLLLVSAIGWVVLVVLHNVFDALASMTQGSAALEAARHVLSGAAFLLAVLVAPPAIVAGATGTLVLLLRERRRGGSSRGGADGP
jgi:uncharacterized membrane protein